MISVKCLVGLKCLKAGGAVEVCATKTVGGPFESTTGVAVATSSVVESTTQHHLHARKTDDLGDLEGEVSQPDTSGKPPLTSPKA